MDDELVPADVGLLPEKVSRRGLFKFAAKVGAGLVAFVPAAAVLLQDIPVAQAAAVGPNACCCTTNYCYSSQYKRWLTYRNCDGQLTCDCITPPDC